MTDTASIVSEFFKRLGLFDADGVSKLFADKIDWCVPASPRLPWAGHRTQPEEVVDFFEIMWSFYHLDQSRPKLDKLIIEGEDAVAVGTFSHVIKKTNLPFTTPFAMHLVVRNGFITKMHLYEDSFLIAKVFSI